VRRTQARILLILVTARNHRSADRTRGGHRHRAVVLHGIWSTTRARVLVFERVPGTSIWWPSSSNLPANGSPALSSRIQAPLPSQRYHFRPNILAALKFPRKGRDCSCWSDRHCRNRFYRGAGLVRLIRGVMPMARFCHRPADLSLRSRPWRGSESIAARPDRQFRSVEEAGRDGARRLRSAARSRLRMRCRIVRLKLAQSLAVATMRCPASFT